MRLALYDINLDGHHGSYLLAIASAAIRREWDVSVVVPAQSSSHHPMAELIRSQIGPGNLHFSSAFVENPRSWSSLSLLRSHLRQREAAHESLAFLDGKCDVIYVSNLDYMDKALQLMGSPFITPLGGMCMRVRFHLNCAGVMGQGERQPEWVERVLFNRLLSLSKVRCITTADPTLREYCLRSNARRYSKVRYVPEIGMQPVTMTRETARLKVGISKDAKVILVYGALTARKGIAELLDAVRLCGPSSELVILVVGQADEETEQFLQGRQEESAAGRLHVIPGFATSDIEQAAFLCADAVWVAYRNHATMSGVYYQSLCAGIPVITADYGIIHWLATRERVGISVNIDSPQATAKAIQALFENHSTYSTYCLNARCLAAEHTPEAFGLAVCSAIEATA